jgi:hypothetical protein
MIHRGLVCLLFAAMAWGQATSSTPAQPAQNPAAQPGPAAVPPGSAAPSNSIPAPDTAAKAEPAKVAPDAPVITLDGVCDNATPDKPASDCKTVVTRAEFENLVSAVAPTMPATARRQLAERYAMALVMSQEARKKGLDQGPKFEELTKISRIQLLSQMLGDNLREQAAQVPDKDIEDYYKKNAENFQEADLQRLFIPHTKQLPASKVKLTAAATTARQKAADAAMKTEADALRKRAAAGEDFTKLQNEAFQFAGLKTKAPNPSMGKTRKSSLPPDQASVMDLKSGEVSPVIANASGYFVYKVGEKDTMPLEQAKEEIHNTLRGQRMQEAMQAVQHLATPKLDDNYFGPPTAPGAQPMMPPGPRPPAQPPSPEPK